MSIASGNARVAALQRGRPNAVPARPMRLAPTSAPLPRGRPETQTRRNLPVLNAVRADKQLDQADSGTLQLIASIME